MTWIALFAGVVFGFWFRARRVAECGRIPIGLSYAWRKPRTVALGYLYLRWLMLVIGWANGGPEIVIVVPRLAPAIDGISPKPHLEWDWNPRWLRSKTARSREEAEGLLK